MAIWAISLVGIGPIHRLSAFRRAKAEHSGFLFTVVINAVVAVWAAPTDESAIRFRKTRIHFALRHWDKHWGLSYILFAVASVCIIAGASIP